jgi:hypothetical protein
MPNWQNAHEQNYELAATGLSSSAGGGGGLVLTAGH